MIVSRHDVADNEKCPICRRVYVNFADCGGMYGCLECGCVFLPKGRREHLRENQVTILSELSSALVCECGFVAKTKAGLVNHKRRCNDEPRSSGN